MPHADMPHATCHATCHACRFKLISYRQPMRFALLRGGFDAPVVVAVSDVIEVAQPNEPLQGHLALTAKQG